MTTGTPIAARWVLLLCLAPPLVTQGDSTSQPDTDDSTRPEPKPEPQPQPKPDKTKENCDPNTDPDCQPQCDPDAFVAWWLAQPPVLNSLRPGNAEYEYEQRVARTDATGSYGVVTRRISIDGPDTIDADGINPIECYLVEAKYAEDPDNTQFNSDPPPWITEGRSGLSGEFERYHIATVSLSIPAAVRPRGLVVRSNVNEEGQQLFRTYLTTAGFMLGVNARVEHRP